MARRVRERRRGNDAGHRAGRARGLERAPAVAHRLSTENRADRRRRHRRAGRWASGVVDGPRGSQRRAIPQREGHRRVRAQVPPGARAQFHLHDRGRCAERSASVRCALVRSRAAEWSIDPAKIGVMGFSAGGQLALLAAMRFDAGDAASKDAIDRNSSRPDFAALVYPGAWPEIKFDANTPPMYLLSGSDDRPEVLSGLTKIFLALREAKVPRSCISTMVCRMASACAPANSGPVAQWPTQFVDWLRVRKFLSGGFLRYHEVRGARRAVHRACVRRRPARHRPFAGHAHLRDVWRRSRRGGSRTRSSATARR